MGTVRYEGDSWKEECNTCRCEQGNVYCTNDECGHIGGEGRCECINPFSGIDSHGGDSEVTCGREEDPFCYVDCKAGCRDIKIDTSQGRCYSYIACLGDVVPAMVLSPNDP